MYSEQTPTVWMNENNVDLNSWGFPDVWNETIFSLFSL